MADTLYQIETRHRVEVNTDPQRRCYNGCHFSSEWQWTQWSILNSGLAPSKVETTLAFWVSLNDYAVSERGPSAKREFRVVPAFPGCTPKAPDVDVRQSGLEATQQHAPRG